MAVLILASCGSRRKTRYGSLPRHGTSSTSKTIPTDASDARNKSLSGSGIDDYAAILGVSARDLNNKSLYAFIDKWLGSPHRLGGSQPSGIDCSGFVGILYREVYGKNLPRTSRDMGNQVKRKYERQLREGDLVFFSFGGRNIDHVGVYLHNNKFVHVSTRRGVIISNMKDSWYYKYFVRAGTPKI
ncbi:glycoside hydrolase [Sphingobacterium haloxyli]|uniref:Glycoside hydrolase n=2 Tax=Sphingobacterium haloxyli TaxID=2100533 RepID=A0A2S9J5G9_9SPHI|nr:glycoside hydrolase [Sphingobacterium haloxyli]